MITQVHRLKGVQADYWRMNQAVRVATDKYGRKEEVCWDLREEIEYSKARSRK